jgi:hypothetical protein
MGSTVGKLGGLFIILWADRRAARGAMANVRLGRSVGGVGPTVAEERPMSHDTTTSPRPGLASSVAWWAGRVLLLLLGLFTLFSTAFFTFFASPEEGGVTTLMDWAVAAWSFAVAIGYLWVAVRIGANPRLRTAAFVLVIAQMVFGVVKMVWYDEMFLLTPAVDVLLLVLFAIGKRR